MEIQQKKVRTGQTGFLSTIFFLMCIQQFTKNATLEDLHFLWHTFFGADRLLFAICGISFMSALSHTECTEL